MHPYLRNSKNILYLQNTTCVSNLKKHIRTVIFNVAGILLWVLSCCINRVVSLLESSCTVHQVIEALIFHLITEAWVHTYNGTHLSSPMAACDTVVWYLQDNIKMSIVDRKLRRLVFDTRVLSVSISNTMIALIIRSVPINIHDISLLSPVRAEDTPMGTTFCYLP